MRPDRQSDPCTMVLRISLSPAVEAALRRLQASLDDIQARAVRVPALGPLMMRRAALLPSSLVTSRLLADEDVVSIEPSASLLQMAESAERVAAWLRAELDAVDPLDVISGLGRDG